MLIILINTVAVVDSWGWPVSYATKLISIVSTVSKSSFVFVYKTPEIKLILDYYYFHHTHLYIFVFY